MKIMIVLKLVELLVGLIRASMNLVKWWPRTGKRSRRKTVEFYFLVPKKRNPKR